MPRSKRLKTEISGGELPEGTHFCVHCQKILKAYDFYPAIDGDILNPKYMSVCKECIYSFYESFLKSESGSVTKAMLKLCRLLNVKFSQEALDSAMGQTETTGADPLKIFGLYKAKVKNVFRSSMGDNSLDLTYDHVTPITIENPTTMANFDADAIDPDVIEFWGDGYDMRDYRWFEKTMDRWKKTHRCETTADETLLREIVFKQWEIEKARKGEEGTSALVKELQEIMKTAAIDPAKASTANMGKSQETFSAFIKIIEENEPAEWFKDKGLFKDFDDIGRKYFIPYVVRSIKNFITGSRDFNVDGDDNGDDDEIIEDVVTNDTEEETGVETEE